MRIPFFSAVVIYLALSVVPPCSAATGCEPVLQELRERYGALPGLSVDYRREVITRALSLTGEKVTGDLAEGRLYFKPPHFIKLVQIRPTEEHLITEGRNVWWYIPEKSSVERYPASFFGKQLSLLGDILQGFPDGLQSFECSAGVQASETVLVLKPDPPWKDVEHITVTVDGEGAISSVGIRNHLGNTTRFTFGSVDVETSLDKDFFTFSPPDGVRLEDRGEH